MAKFITMVRFHEFLSSETRNSQTYNNLLDHHFIAFFFKFQNIVELILISLDQSLQYVISHMVVLI